MYLEHLEVLIRFLRFPERPFLLHGVEHSVAILSLVLVRETDDRQLSVNFILCVQIAKFIIYTMYIFKKHVHKNIDISTLDMTLPYIISMATPIASEQLVLYYTVILFYSKMLIHLYG